MVSGGAKAGICLGCGAFTVVSGAVMAIFWPAMFFSQLKNMMILTPDSMSFDVWHETPIPMYLECFFLHIENTEEMIARPGVKPKVVQMGPYVFSETHTKANITFNDNSTVTFFNQRYWYFVPEKSNGSLSDNVTSINPIVVTIAYMLRFDSRTLRFLANQFMRSRNEHMFLTANVSSWLFDGIDDPILDIATGIPALKDLMPFDRFGWFYTRNGSKTFDGTFLMNTGAEDFSSLGNVEKWKYSNRTMYREHCGEVRGSTGELWAPELGQPEVYIFAPDICTYMILTKDQDHTVEGITGVRYQANASVFDNGHHYPHMACYCDDKHPEQCMRSGALNVSECRFGAPAFVSQPHFYNADKAYIDAVEGLEPTPDMNFRLTLEMFTGMPLAVAAQLQINMLVKKVPLFTILEPFANDTMVPMFWFRQELEITPEYARMARFALNLREGMMIAFYVITAIGVCVLIAGIVVLIRNLLSSPDPRLIAEDEQNESE